MFYNCKLTFIRQIIINIDRIRTNIIIILDYFIPLCKKKKYIKKVTTVTNYDTINVC